MNNVINKFSLAGDKFMPEIHLRQLQFTYSMNKELKSLKKLVIQTMCTKIKYDGYQRGLAFMIYKFFDSKVSGSGAKLIPENENLAYELHKPIIRKFEKRKVYSIFKDNI